MQHGVVLSEVLAHPGPTHSVADVIAAVVQATSPGSQLAMLGFAGGGMLAPLRSMGAEHDVRAVDLDDSGWRLFQRLCSSWAGDVVFERAEACAWFRRSSSCYDIIVEDLSVSLDSDVFKPEVTWRELPPLIYQRLKPGGVAIFNLLRPTDCAWEAGLHQIMQSGFASRLIHFKDYENRLLVVGRTLPGAHRLSRQLGALLSSVRSRQASRIAVRRGLP